MEESHPPEAQRVRAPTGARSESGPAGRGRVLLAHPDREVRERLSSTLDVAGYAVDVAEVGSELTARVSRRRYDAVVAWLPPGDAGAALLDGLDRASPETPVIAVSERPSVESAIAAVRRGARDYLVEPVEPSELREAVGRATSRGPVSRQLDELKRRFISNVSHELRTPLTSIRGYSALMLRRGAADERLRHSLSAIARAADQLQQLIEELVDMSEIEAGRLRLEPRPVSLREAIDAAVERASPTAREQGVRVTVAPARLVAVRADPARLAQILNKLLSYAIRFTLEGGSVTVHALEGGALARVVVTNAGVGGLPGDQPRLASGVVGASPRVRGMGLSLAFAKALVEAHSGLLWIESEAGRGTTVHFTLPLADPAPPGSDADSDAEVDEAARRAADT